MNKKSILAAIFVTLFLDFFNLGLIYPIFSSLVFEENISLVTGFSKNAIFGCLIAAFPFGQFLGAPILGKLSDHYGRRSLLLLSLCGTVATLLLCGCATFSTSLLFLFIGRFLGGLMASNMTLAYAALADYSSADEKVKNFALIPLATGIGFALGPYLAGMLANPTLAFFTGAVLSLFNLVLVFFVFPETQKIPEQNSKSYVSYFIVLWKALNQSSLRPYLLILFFMISSNLLFVQYVGPFAIEKFHIDITGVGYLYANIGISVAIGHAFLTRRLAGRFSSESALSYSLLFLALLLVALVFSWSLLTLHVLTFFVMLACAVGYTNAMALVSNQASQENQGEIMGVAVAIQSLSEFLPAAIVGCISTLFFGCSMCVAVLCALFSFSFLYIHTKKALQKE